jgi:hypothetical protein
VDVQNAMMIAFAVKDGGSWQIQTSQVLPGLEMNVIESALRRNQMLDDTEVNHWLMEQFQAIA